MELYFAGGYGEHGRNCFYLTGSTGSFMVDCGIMPGAAEPFPALTPAQIADAAFVLLTHAHADHVGALPWLYGNGFEGTVFLSECTYNQLRCPPKRYQFIDAMTPPLLPCTLLPGITMTWGRSGHCAGAVWYALALDGKRLVFSGDYTEHSTLYACDPLENQQADAAVLDCAYATYPPDVANEGVLRTRFADCAAGILGAGQKLILPVPKYGRGPELALILHRLLPEVPLCADDTLRAQSDASGPEAFWLREDAAGALRRLHLHSQRTFEKTQGPAACLLSDPQLKHWADRPLADIAAGPRILLTGHCDEGSLSAALLEKGLAEFRSFPVHQGMPEFQALCQHNRFARTFAVHSDRFAPVERVTL